MISSLVFPPHLGYTREAVCDVTGGTGTCPQPPASDSQYVERTLPLETLSWFTHEGMEMRRSFHTVLAVLLVTFVLTTFSLSSAAERPTVSKRWRITSVKICRSSGGAVYPSIEAIGTYPVYSFFIPRPVWTVNGSVVQAKPVYENGRLVSFQLYNASNKLNPGTRNTVKFALPDQNGSCVFLYDHSQIPAGECYEFF